MTRKEKRLERETLLNGTKEFLERTSCERTEMVPGREIGREEDGNVGRNRHG